MSTTITGVHFVYRPAHAPERSQAMADVALLQRERQVQITGIEYSDGRFDPFDDEPAPPPSDFTVSLTYQDGHWIAAFSGPNGFMSSEFAHQSHAIATIFNDVLIAGGGDWCAVNRRTGDVA